ncbi:MAG: LPXTG cell wall anchor domain-containing protein [Oribacterium sp.]|nr:LPXTG cell wall anchor domain-containing protein [Oribacterium sp.]
MKKLYTEFKAFFSSRFKKQFMSLLMAAVILFLSVTGAAETSIAAYRDNYINSILERYEDGELSRDEARRELIRHGVKDTPIFDFDEDSDGNKISTQSDIPAKLGEAERRLDEKILSAIDKISSSKSAFVYARHRDTIENDEAVIEDLATKSEVQKDSKSSDSKAAETKKATASEIEQGVFYLEETDETKADSGSKSEEINSTEKETIGTDGDPEADAIDISDYLTISSVKRLSNGDLVEASEFDSNKKINVTLFFNIPGEDLSEEDRSVVYMIPEGLTAVKEESGNVRSDGRSIGRYVLKEDSLTISFDRSFVKKGKDIDGAFYFKAKTMVDSDDDMVEVELGGLAGSISVYKAQTMTSISDDGKVSVTASYGIAAFKENVTLRVTALENEEAKNAEEAFNNLLRDENLFVRNIYPYDISFINEDGNEVEPDGNVSISMEFTEPVETEENAEVKVYHIENNDLNFVRDLTESEETVVSQDEDGSVQKIEFSTDSFSQYAMVETGIDIAGFLTNASIENARSDDGKTWVVRNGETYKLMLEFSETNRNQFPDNDTWMIYRIPSGLYLKDKEDTFTVVIDDSHVIRGNRIVVDSTEGIIGFQWNKDSDNYNMLLNSTNVKLYAELEGHFDKSTKTVKFSNSVTRYIKVDDSHKVNVYKTGYYDKKDNKIHYTVTLVAEGVSEDITVEDRIDGKALSLDTDSISINGGKNACISSKSGEGFTITVPKMTDGETINITYTASVDIQKIAKSGQVTFDETGNTVTVKIPEIENAIAKHYESDISYSSIVKYGALVDSSDVASTTSRGGTVRNVSWTILANEEKLTSVSYIKDTIDDESRSNMKYSGTGIHVEVTFEDGSTESRDIPWSSLNRENDYSWTYTVPKSDGKASYKVTYNTAVTVYDNVYDFYVKNHAETDHAQTTESLNVIPHVNVDVNASKQATNVTLNEASWIIQVTIPAKGADRFVIEDQLPNVWAENRHMYDEFSELVSVDGLSGSESYKLDTTGEKLTFTFYKDGANEGLNASASDRIVTIVYKTKNSREWLEYAQESGNGYYLEHTNIAKVRLNNNELWINAKAYPPVENLKKTGSYYGSYEGKLIYSYDLILAGVSSGEVIIDDIFDTRYLSYLGELEYNTYLNDSAARIYVGNDQYYAKDASDMKASVSKTETGIRFYIKDFPKTESGDYYVNYRIHYYLVINESDAIRLALENDGKATIRNTAYWNSEKDQVDISYEHNPVNKEYSYDSEKGHAFYTITVNPSKEMLNQGAVMTLEDEFENQTIDISTIRISAEDKSGKNRASEISYSMDGNFLTFENIPDETKVVITYEAVPVYSTYSKSVTLTNRATLMGYEDETVFDAYFNALAKASGSTAKLKLVKYKEDDIQTLLSGAVFDLYIIENGERKPVNDKNGHIIQFTTGPDGTANIALDYETTGQKLYFDQQYCLVESKAPEGYVAGSDNAYYFTLVAPANGDSNYSYDSDSSVYPNGYVLSVSNRSFLGMLLPDTGGRGTAMIYLAGFIMTLLGSAFIVFKRHKNVR